MSGDIALHPGLLKQLGERCGWLCVCEESVYFSDIAQLDHCRAIELAAVSCQPDLARMFNDGPGDLDLAVIEVAQRSVGFNGRNADQADIDLELSNKFNGRLAHDATITRANYAARDNHFTIRVVGKYGCHIQVVGYDAQPFSADKLARNRFGGRSNVQDQ